MNAHEHDDDGYAGPALLVTATSEYAVQVRLAGFFQPVLGRYHWHGRISGQLAALAGDRHEAVLVTPEGSAVCLVRDPDLWGRFAVSGHGRPPFLVDTALPDVA